MGQTPEEEEIEIAASEARVNAMTEDELKVQVAAQRREFDAKVKQVEQFLATFEPGSHGYQLAAQAMTRLLGVLEHLEHAEALAAQDDAN